MGKILSIIICFLSFINTSFAGNNQISSTFEFKSLYNIGVVERLSDLKIDGYFIDFYSYIVNNYLNGHEINIGLLFILSEFILIYLIAFIFSFFVAKKLVYIGNWYFLFLKVFLLIFLTIFHCYLFNLELFFSFVLMIFLVFVPSIIIHGTTNKEQKELEDRNGYNYNSKI